MSRRREHFGTGEPEGILATESSNNATVGGAVISKSKEHVDAVRFVMNSTGTIMSPQVASRQVLVQASVHEC